MENVQVLGEKNNWLRGGQPAHLTIGVNVSRSTGIHNLQILQANQSDRPKLALSQLLRAKKSNELGDSDYINNKTVLLKRKSLKMLIFWLK